MMFTKSTTQPHEHSRSRSVAGNTRSGRRAFPAVPVFKPGIVQRARIRTGMDMDAENGTNSFEVDEMAIVAALYQKFTTLASKDFPRAPFIESSSNQGRLNRSEQNAHGDIRVLGEHPVNDLWQLTMDYKKHRSLGAVNIVSNTDEGMASAIYNQYGRTQTKWENTDVMIYKHPERGEEEDETTASDKGVSYKLAATKFAEMREALEWNDSEIASAVLQYYQDGKLPAKVSKEGQTRNFGYIVTLMTVPESARSVGTFPMGLMMLDNIKTGVETSESAFLPDETMATEVKERAQARAPKKAPKKKEEEEKKEEVKKEAGPPPTKIPAYKDAADLGGTYAPAFSGSKAPLNTMESRSEEGFAYSTTENKQNYYWDKTLERYVGMVKKFLAGNPKLLDIGLEIDDAVAATQTLIDRILQHFGIGEGIVTDNTRQLELRRTTNNILYNTHTTITTSFSQYPPTPGSPLGEYQDLLKHQVEDPLNDRAVIKKSGGDKQISAAFGVDQGKKKIKHQQKSKKVVGQVIDEVNAKKRKRTEEKTEEEPIPLNPQLMKKARFRHDIDGIVLEVLGAYTNTGEQISVPALVEATKNIVLVDFKKTVEFLGLSPENVEATIVEVVERYV